jgi:hypothetical protein
MVDTRFKPRRARSRLAAGRVFSEYLQGQRVDGPDENRQACVAFECESATRSGNLRTPTPA